MIPKCLLNLRTAAAALAGALVFAVVAVPSAQAGDSNIKVVWTDTELEVVVPIAAWAVEDDSQRIGCVGAVKLTFPGGAQQTFVGAALGPSGCTTAEPCLPYAPLEPTIDCQASSFLSPVLPVFLTVPASADVDLANLEVGCLKEFFLDIDIDGDGQVDSHNGPFFGFAGCSW